MRIISFILFFLLSTGVAMATNISGNGVFSSAAGNTPWVNDLKNLFISKRAVIYALNVRTFNAVDINGNDIIEPESGEVSGNFLNAAERLDELVGTGINTIYLLPITKTGKLKALGTAGSLYAMDSFDTISPFLDDKNDPRSVDEEAKFFVQKAHKLGFRVIADMPSCGSYDLSLERPDLFLKDKNGAAVIPADWTDVRLFRVYEEGTKGEVNNSLVENYKKFIDMALELGFDGIRADVAAIKPYEFWKEIIDYTRSKSPQFLFLAEAETSWGNPAKAYVPVYSSVEKLLEAGFDGYYGDWGNFKNFKSRKEITKRLKLDEKIAKKFDGKKATMASFATHDQQSPLMDGNANYWEMVLWLTTTLPTNSYFLDGFQTGDTYIFKYENKPAPKSYTDDDTYFLHSGKFDIFNLSRKPGTNRADLYEIFKTTLKFQRKTADILHLGKTNILKTNSKSVFAYEREYRGEHIIVVGNLDFKNPHYARVEVNGLTKKSFLLPIKINNVPTVRRGSLGTELNPNEVQVYVFSKRAK